MSVPSGTKFIGIASNVDTLERKSALANSPSQVYTIEDIADVARPYKVYTALLTQSGGDNPENFTWNYGEPEPPIPEIQYGVTYLIVANDSATDFTVCGAPNNNAGTYFVANGIQPDWSEPYEDGSIGISWNTGAPVVTVLENTLGFNPYFLYTNPAMSGYYNSNNQEWVDIRNNFKPVFVSLNNANLDVAYECRANFSYEEGQFFIQTYIDGILSNDVLSDYDNFYLTSLEIRVYN